MVVARQWRRGRVVVVAAAAAQGKEWEPGGVFDVCGLQDLADEPGWPGSPWLILLFDFFVQFRIVFDLGQKWVG
jgi:hypothetical protein